MWVWRLAYNVAGCYVFLEEIGGRHSLLPQRIQTELLLPQQVRQEAKAQWWVPGRFLSNLCQRYSVTSRGKCY